MNLLRNSLIFLTLVASTLPAQELIHSLQLGGAAGSSVAGVGDIDGDGRDDFAVADSHNGGVNVFSGHDASVLLTLPVAAIGHSFGNLPSYVIDAGGDGNGDGIPDVLVTRIGDSLAGPGGYVPIGPGSATLWSGADGSVLWTAGPTGQDLGNSFGFAAANIGDTDGDGRDDFAVGAPVEAIAGQSDVGWVEVPLRRDRTVAPPGPRRVVRRPLRAVLGRRGRPRRRRPRRLHRRHLGRRRNGRGPLGLHGSRSHHLHGRLSRDRSGHRPGLPLGDRRR